METDTMTANANYIKTSGYKKVCDSDAISLHLGDRLEKFTTHALWVAKGKKNGGGTDEH